jgi:multimeric flavodoxin WrbA
MSTPHIVAINGSPRRDGNTATLIKQAVQGAREAGVSVEEINLRDYKISPCLEIYNCIKSGKCAIKDDFPAILDKIEACDAIILGSPIFFYTVSAHTKIFMDRCQSLWVRKYWIQKREYGTVEGGRKGLFISVGATQGKKLFTGALLTVRYFFDVLDVHPWDKVLCRGLDHKGEAQKNIEYMENARAAGTKLARSLVVPE